MEIDAYIKIDLPNEAAVAAWSILKDEHPKEWNNIRCQSKLIEAMREQVSDEKTKSITEGPFEFPSRATFDYFVELLEARVKRPVDPGLLKGFCMLGDIIEEAREDDKKRREELRQKELEERQAEREAEKAKRNELKKVKTA